MAKQRDISIDMVKGIGIFSVILGHMGISWVSTFHMVLFFVLSGYFISDKLPYKKFFFKKLRQLILPYGIGCLLTIVGSVLINIITKDYVSIPEDVKIWFIAALYGKGTKRKILIPGVHKIGALWFLLATFYGSVIVRYFLNSKYMPIFITIIGYIGITTSKIVFLPFSIQNGMVASFFMMLGFYMKNTRDGDLLKKPCKRELYIGCFLLWIFALYNKITMSMVNLKFPYGLLNVIVALSALYVIVHFTRWFIKNTESSTICRKIIHLVSFYGKNSLWILVFHGVEINLLQYEWISSIFSTANIYFLFLIQFLFRVLFCTCGTLIVKKIIET